MECSAHRRIGQWIKRSVGIASFALARDLVANFSRKRGFGAIYVSASRAACLSAFLPIGKLKGHAADALGHNRRTATQDGGEIRQRNGPAATGVRTTCHDIEGRFGVNPIICAFIAGRTQVRDRCRHVQIGAGGRTGSTERRDIARVIGNPNGRTGTPHRGNADTLIDHQVPFLGASGQR